MLRARLRASFLLDRPWQNSIPDLTAGLLRALLVRSYRPTLARRHRPEYYPWPTQSPSTSSFARCLPYLPRKRWQMASRRSTSIDPILMILPPPARSIYAWAACEQRKMLVRLVSTTKCQSCAVRSCGALRMFVPALLTRISRRPKRSTSADGGIALARPCDRSTPCLRHLHGAASRRPGSHCSVRT